MDWSIKRWRSACWKCGGTASEVVNTGREALDALQRRSFDVVLMDLEMPDMDGLEATAAIREQERLHGGHIPIIGHDGACHQGFPRAVPRSRHGRLHHQADQARRNVPRRGIKCLGSLAHCIGVRGARCIRWVSVICAERGCPSRRPGPPGHGHYDPIHSRHHRANRYLRHCP